MWTAAIPEGAPQEGRTKDPSMCPGPVIDVFAPEVNTILWRKENFACVRIFHWGSRRKTDNLDEARIRRERTRN